MLIRDFNGNIIPLGKTIRTISEPFFLGTLPGWMTVTGDTGYSYSIAGPDTDQGYLQVTAAAGVGNRAFLNLFPNGLNFVQTTGIPKIKEVIIELDSLVFDSANLTFYVDLRDASGQNGFLLTAVGNNPQSVTITGYNANTPTTVNVNYDILYQLDVPERSYKRNLVCRFQWDGTYILAEGDSVFCAGKFTSSQINTNYLLYPKVWIYNSDTASHYFRVSQVSCSVVTA